MKKTIVSLFLVICAFNTQAQHISDTIKIRKDFGKIYIYNDKKLKPKQMLEIMKPNLAAYHEMKRAKTNFDVGSVFGFTGGFLVGWSIGSSLIRGKEIDWRAVGVGAGLIGVSIPFSIGQAKHTKKAVKMFNDDVKSSTSSIQLKINGTVNKIGIVANF